MTERPMRTGADAIECESVAICICTCGRPDGLERLLRGIGRLAFTKCRPRVLKVVVVDNDADGTAKAVCERVRQCSPMKIEYSIEPRRGISFARNHALAKAKDYELVAFIDDDEVPDPEWIEELLTVRRQAHADIVCGPVLPYFPNKVPKWMLEGRFYERPRYATGTKIRDPRTSNVLIYQGVIDATGNFDERFALTGGEDSDFFNRASSLGFEVYWSNEACVTEWIPKSRSSASWLLRRSFRYGNTYMFTSLRMNPVATLYCLNVLRGTWRLCASGLLALLSFPRGRARSFGELCRAMKGAGMLAAALGINYEEYKVIHRV